MDDPRWRGFVQSRPEATPFHHPAWAELLSRSYGFDAVGLALLGSGAEIEAAVPLLRLGGRSRRRRAISLPFTDWVAPLGRADTERLEDARVALGLGSLEIRDRIDGEGGYAVEQGHRHVVALDPDPAKVRAGFDRSRVERKLRRSEREGIDVRRSDARAALLEDFYPLHVSTRRRLGVPVQPKRFFELLFERLFGAGLGFVVTAYADGAPAASTVILASNRTLVYKFSASDRRLGDVGATQAVIWEAIRWGCEHGFREFDFGRTDLGHDGLRSFKAAWGGEELGLTYTAFADTPPRSGPRRGTQLLGSVLRRSPELVTRAAGRVGYRYTA